MAIFDIATGHLHTFLIDLPVIDKQNIPGEIRQRVRTINISVLLITLPISI